MTVARMRPAVFLDRDGILCRSVVREGKPYPPAGWSSFALVEGAKDGCDRLRHQGFALVCVTNQPDLSRGSADAKLVNAMNDHLRRELMLDDIRVCMHDDKDGCACRKPKPGLIVDAARDHGVDLTRSYMVGDRWRDMGAGRTAGCRCVFVDYGYDERRPESSDFVAKNVVEALVRIANDALAN